LQFQKLTLPEEGNKGGMLEAIKPLFYFDTVKLVTVHSVKLGAFHRFIQLAAILYIVLYSIWIKEGYQEYSKVSGVIYTKAKGIGYVNGTNGVEIFDTSDLVEPPTESEAMFLTAGLVTTVQTRSTCDSTIPCTTDSDCTPALTSNGEILNNCDTNTGLCQIKGWCPLEDDSSANIQVLTGVEEVTVFIRTSVRYDTFDVYQADPTDPIKDLNLFTVQQIIGNRNISECALSGCIVAVQIDWSCNLNKGPCQPKINFQPVTGGFNFRKVNYDVGSTSRELDKLFGVRLLMSVVGTGARFSIFQTFITIGAGAAFITLATVITDLVLLFLFREQANFSDKKWSQLRLQSDDPVKI